jgi:hypothetical protein
MTREELDTLWNRSVNESIKAGDSYARYRYAEYVAEAEREAEREAILAYCEAVCKAQAGYGPPPCWMQLIGFIRARGSK